MNMTIENVETWYQRKIFIKEGSLYLDAYHDGDAFELGDKNTNASLSFDRKKFEALKNGLIDTNDTCVVDNLYTINMYEDGSFSIEDCAGNYNCFSDTVKVIKMFNLMDKTLKEDN